MTETAAESNFANWSVPGHSVQIEYAAAVLEQIRQTAVDGYLMVPHGGVETGGILFGTHHENAVRVIAWRPIHCAYAKGPSFVLSEKDESALSKALVAYHKEPDLAALEPVGWYRSHTRSEILLSEGDLAFYNRFFPQPWQIGLIVRPGSFTPTRAGFFFREVNGRIRGESSYREFVVAPVPIAESGAALAPIGAVEDEVAPNGSGVSAVVKALQKSAALDEPPPSPATDAPALEPWPEFELKFYQPARFGWRWLWFAAIPVILLAGAAGGYWLLDQQNAKPLPLSVVEAGGQLRIAWDRTDRRIVEATAGTVDIDDRGVRTKVDLTPADLRSGSIVYARQSGDVGIRLLIVVPGSAPVVETTRFVSPVSASTPAVVPLDQPKQSDPQPVETRDPPKPPVHAPAARPFRAPTQAPPRVTAEMPSIAPPKIDTATGESPAGLPSVLGHVPSPPPGVVPATPARTATVAPGPTPPGRIIWTGKLTKNGRLVIQSNHASIGALSAALPMIAARVSAFPGDLTPAGITLFTSDARYYYKPLTEKPGADNGWNPTRYVWDPKRAAAVEVVEQPGPQNGFKLVLKSESKVSVVVLEWRATQ